VPIIRYVLGYSPAERVLSNLSLRANACVGRGLAIASAMGWLIFVASVLDVGGVDARFIRARGQAIPGWVLGPMFVLILIPFLYGRMIAERDLSARIDTSIGVGRRWRWLLAVACWGMWAYWLVGARRLPAAVEVLSPNRSDEDGK
jgi:hypothetical protein